MVTYQSFSAAPGDVVRDGKFRFVLSVAILPRRTDFEGSGAARGILLQRVHWSKGQVAEVYFAEGLIVA